MKPSVTFYIIIGLIAGAIIACLFSIFQNILIGAETDYFTLRNYIVPIGLGAIVGMSISFLWYRSNRVMLEKSIVEERAMTDDLTGLYNRRGFFFLVNPQIELAIRNNKKLLLIYADIDNLKGINDKLGHDSGDRALIETANLLKNTFRKSDIIARLGGDEFVIFCVDTEEENYNILLDHIKNSLKDFNKMDNDINLSLSFGKAVYNPKYPLSIDKLLSQADAEMYKEKKSKNRSGST
jgi:diguanylate cyclase (GGDEF)-like protein